MKHRHGLSAWRTPAQWTRRQLTGSCWLWRVYVPHVLLVLTVATIGCSFAITPDPTPTLEPQPRLSYLEAVAYVKAQWPSFVDEAKAAIPYPCGTVVRTYEGCAMEHVPPGKLIPPARVGGSLAVEFYGRDVVAAIESSCEAPIEAVLACELRWEAEKRSLDSLATQGLWDPRWEPDTKSWLVRAYHDLGTVRFRLFETTLTVELLQ